MSRKKSLPYSPEQLQNLKLSSPKTIAAGAEALKSAIKHAVREMGWVATLPTLSKANQKGGFDCPGCAWPDPDDKRSSLGEYCENGVKAIAEEATRKRVGPSFFATYSVEELSRKDDLWIGKSGRITHPMVLRKGATHYEPIEWEEAFSLVADTLNALPNPNQATFYTSGRTSNEAAFLYQLFVRMYGTNNLPDCSNMCHESSGVALAETVGIGKGSVKLEDFEKAEVICISGQNPGTNHPRMLSALKKAKKNGAKIIAINPLKEAGLLNFRDPQNPADLLGKTTQLADLYLQVQINQDVALAKALLILLKQAEEEYGGVFDQEFINQQTEGYEALMAHMEEQSLDSLIESTKIPKEAIQEFAQLLASSKRIIWCWAMGLTQHKNAVDNIREVVNILLLKGSIGKPGAGTCPVRGHSNVQGDRTMGISHKPSAAFLQKLTTNFSFDPPKGTGLDVVESIEAMHKGKVRVFFAMGGNFLSASPDTEFTAEALQNCKLTVHVSTKLNRSHLIHGEEALILPCISRTEKDLQASGKQFVSIENSMGVVHMSEGRKFPASSELRSEPAIIADLAIACLGETKGFSWKQAKDNYDYIREAIAQTIPGCENYNNRVRVPGGFYLPNCAREKSFHTASQKAQLTINQVAFNALEEGEYLMMTIRSHDQFNTTLYGMDDRYRGVENERRVIFMNREDINRAGLKSLQIVHLSSEYDGKKRWARTFQVIPYDIPSTCVATYFPEANPLVPIHITADRSNTPASKSIRIRIHPI
ncbi:MAG: FdhF/YdeP family oxidoreductase [Bacteroidota bacterium]